MNPIHLDHNAGSPLRPRALRAMTDALRDLPGNASSIHRLGQAAAARLDGARRAVAAWLGAAPDEIVFTGSGTEAVVTAVVGTARAARGRGRHVVTTAVEHAAGAAAARILEEEGFQVTRILPDAEGRVDAERVLSALRSDTVLVSVIHAQNETGVVQPLKEIAAAARRRGIAVHSDAVQSAGKLPLDALEVDLLSVAAHKLGGPKGIGALRIRRGAVVSPLIPGSQERGFRGGTVDVAAAAGFAVVAEDAPAFPAESAAALALRDRLVRAVLARVPSARLTGAGHERLPNTAHFTFDPRVGPDLVPALDLAGYAVSAGSACSAGSLDPSPALLAMGRTAAEARTAVRVSLGPGTTAEEIDGFADALARVVAMRLGDGGAGSRAPRPACLPARAAGERA